MPVLEQTLNRRKWTQEIALRNGHAMRPMQSSASGTENAGPWDAAVQEIVSYLGLGDNWDGHGAEAPSHAVLESAIGLAYCYLNSGVAPPHRVAPGVAGSVIFEWQEADGTYATVEIDAPLHAEVMFVAPGKGPQQWTLPTE